MSAPLPGWTPQFGERVRILAADFEGETGQVCSVETVPGQAVYVQVDGDGRWPAMLMQPHELAPLTPEGG